VWTRVGENSVKSTASTCFPAAARELTTPGIKLWKVFILEACGLYELQLPESRTLTIIATRTVASGHAVIIWSIRLPRRLAALSGSLPSVDMFALLFISFVPAKRRMMLGLMTRDGPTLSAIYLIVRPDQAACLQVSIGQLDIHLIEQTP